MNAGPPRRATREPETWLRRTSGSVHPRPARTRFSVAHLPTSSRGRPAEDFDHGPDDQPRHHQQGQRRPPAVSHDAERRGDDQHHRIAGDHDPTCTSTVSDDTTHEQQDSARQDDRRQHQTSRRATNRRSGPAQREVQRRVTELGHQRPAKPNPIGPRELPPCRRTHTRRDRFRFCHGVHRPPSTQSRVKPLRAGR